MNLLLLHASPRRERSLSRRLAAAFVTQWQAAHPTGTVRERDVGIAPPPLLTETWIAACFTPEGERTQAQRDALAYSDAAIEELAKIDPDLVGDLHRKMVDRASSQEVAASDLVAREIQFGQDYRRETP